MSVRTAIQLKEAIDQAPSVLTALGTCYSIEKDWKNDYDYEEDKSENSSNEGENNSDSKTAFDPKLLNQIEELINEVEREVYGAKNPSTALDTFPEGDLSKYTLEINFKDDSGSTVEYKSTLDQVSVEKLSELYDQAPVATFGNLEEMETQVNAEVRAARDLTSGTHFTVSSEICDQIASLWRENFFEVLKIRVEPYKINLYGKGGKFKEHRDTPSKNLIGTFLLGLGDTSNEEAVLKIRDKDYSYEHGEYPVWERTSLGSWCGFYPDLPHEVTEVTEGLRANLSFKVFVEPGVEEAPAPPAHDPKVTLKLKKTESQWREVLQKYNKPFGIILTHDYSLNAESLKGKDRSYLDFFTKLGMKTFILPAIIEFSSYYCPEYEPARCNSSVYPLTDECIEYVLDKENNPCPDSRFDHDLFFFRNPKGYKWYSDSTSYCEYTGNECQPGEEDSLYLHRVLIVKPDQS